MSENEPRVVIVIVHMHGCPACEEYVPQVKALSGPYERQGIPVLYIEADDQRPEAQRWMNDYDIQDLPTTLVLKNKQFGGGVWKMTGSQDEAQIRQMLDFAHYEATR